MKQKAMVFLLILCLTLMLAACTKSEGGDSTGSEEISTEVSYSTAEALVPAAEAEYVELGGGENVASVKKVIGERALIRMSTFASQPDGATTTTYTYGCDSKDRDQMVADIEKYVQYLAEQEKFEKFDLSDMGNASQVQMWSKMSADASMEITLTVLQTDEGYTLSLAKIPVQEAVNAGTTTPASLESAAAAEFMDLGNDRVSSIKKVLGQRTLTSMSVYTSTPDGAMTVTYHYHCDPGQKAGDTQAYAAYLVEQEKYEKNGLTIEENEDVQMWRKASVDGSMEIYVSLVPDDEGYSLSLSKMPVQ